MADTIKDILFGYRYYMTECQSENKDEYSCRLLFILDVITLLIILFAFLVIMYLLKKDRDENRHEE